MYETDELVRQAIKRVRLPVYLIRMDKTDAGYKVVLRVEGIVTFDPALGKIQSPWDNPSPIGELRTKRYPAVRIEIEISHLLNADAFTAGALANEIENQWQQLQATSE